MKITVGSGNPNKVAAVREVIKESAFRHATITSTSVESGVHKQPKTLAETMRGAKNRAKASFKDCDLSIGLESGFFKVPMTITGHMDMCVCAIYDGKRTYFGFSCAHEYPVKVTRLVFEKGKDISEAMKVCGLTDKEYIGYEEGAISVLSKGKISRKEYTKQAVMMALIPLENPQLYK
jgi:inosine/xanthosine triphosphatase